jgi:ribosome-binding ATPase YchF (GTP1/OBG family)
LKSLPASGFQTVCERFPKSQKGVAPLLKQRITLAYDELMKCGSVAAAREKGLYRMEGKEYVVKDGDVLLFKFNV